MAQRTIIQIDEDLCDGCGLCANGCPEGALRIIDGKARMVGDSLCDGLGACIGDCPRGAITTIVREATAYDEGAVIKNIIPKGRATILAHLEHLYSHGQETWYRQAISCLAQEGITLTAGELPHEKRTETAERVAQSTNPLFTKAQSCSGGACPGSAMRSFTPHSPGTKAPIPEQAPHAPQGGSSRSELTQWPIQLHLINPRAPYFEGADLLIAASCTAFACGAFHPALLKGKKVIIACPKLDANQEVYADKIRTLVSESALRSITLAIMEVPCCGGLSRLLSRIIEETGSTVSVSTVVVGIEGGSLTWM